MKHKWPQICLIGFLIALAALVAYWPALDNQFVDFDDPLYVTENAMLQRGLNFETIRWALTSKHAFNWHPLTWISLMFDFEFYRLRPMGYHLSNMLLHAFNAFLLCIVLTRMTRALWPSAFVAALFALHPLHVESVAWVSERKDVLSACFWMLVLWGYAHYAEKPGWVRYALVVGLLALGLMAKPMLVSLPLVLCWLDYWPLRRLTAGLRWKDGWNWKRAFWEKAPLLALAAVACVITFRVQHATGAVASLHQYPLLTRLANAVMAYQGYLLKMFWPTRLACLYPYRETFILHELFGAVLVLGMITALALWLYRRAPWLIVGWLWYLVALLPVIGLVQVGNQAMADRYAYLPLIGIYIMLAWSVRALARRYCMHACRWVRVILALLAAALLMLLGWGTWRQAGYWRDTVAVFERALAVTENNYLAHNNLANVLPGYGRLDEAVWHYAQALSIKPDYAEAHNNLGVALARRGNLEQAVYHYRQALRMRPDCAEVYVNLGTVFFNQGRLDEAVNLFAEAVRVNPFLANAHYNLGVVLAQNGMLPEAVGHYVAALEIKPDMVDAYGNLIRALLQYGEPGKAMIAFRAMARLYRRWLPAMTANLQVLAGYIDLSAVDRADLIALAEQLNPPAQATDPVFLEALGVAYAGIGRFDAALAVTRRAIALVGVSAADDAQKLLTMLGERMARYESRLPVWDNNIPATVPNALP